MNRQSEPTPDDRRRRLSQIIKDQPDFMANVLRRVGTVASFFVLMAAFLFLAAGRLDWGWAWAYLGICLASVLINASIMLRTGLETIAERGARHEAPAWDKVVGSLWAMALYLALPLVAGLDVRFNWRGDLSIAWHLVGAVLLAAGLGLTAWAMIENTYFSTAVRIQTDRGHRVCTTGPYRFVRHPGYVGFIFQAVSAPLLLGSTWALIPGVVTVILAVIRTLLEDRMLQAELPGYQEYAQQVRYRLIPGVW